ncbi:hypothetical protein Bca101_058635 [Brassica carinata]
MVLSPSLFSSRLCVGSLGGLVSVRKESGPAQFYSIMESGGGEWIGGVWWGAGGLDSRSGLQFDGTFQSSPWKLQRLSLAWCRAQLATPACVGVTSGGAWSDVVMRCRLESYMASPRHCHILSSNHSSLPSSQLDTCTSVLGVGVRRGSVVPASHLVSTFSSVTPRGFAAHPSTMGSIESLVVLFAI